MKKVNSPKDITIPNVYTPNNIASKYVRQKYNRNTRKCILSITVGRSPLEVIDKTNRQNSVRIQLN